MQSRDPINGLETISSSKKILALIESLGALRAADSPPLRCGEQRLDILDRYGIERGHRFVVLHTGARLAYSRWPHFAALTELILERTALDVVVMQDAASDADAHRSSDRVRLLTGRLPFEDFDTLLCGCAAFVGNDSGIKHLAALRGAPTISLHMARLNWSEWGQEARGTIISRHVPCAGCALHQNGEECGQDYACIRQITAEEVFDALLDAIER